MCRPIAEKEMINEKVLEKLSLTPGAKLKRTFNEQMVGSIYSVASRLFAEIFLKNVPLFIIGQAIYIG